MPRPDELLAKMQQASPEVEKLRNAERVNSDLKDRLKAAEKLNEELERELGIMSRIGHRSTPPTWLKSPKKAKPHHGTPWLLLSDLHLDEVIDPAEIRGVNCFNRAIAEMRLKRTFENAVEILRDYWMGVDYDGIVCPMAGDIFSGDIHEELTITNADTILASCDYWIDPMAAGINLLAQEFGKVHVPVVVGNHGRRSRKPRAKMRARDNFDWFFALQVARCFKDNPNVTFDISEAADTLVPCYGWNVNVTHGDQTRGGGGIGGIWPPIMRMDAKKRQRYAAVNTPFDLMVLGHWHQLVWGPNFIVNGSLKGFDEYAFVENFTYEEPQQALWMMTPENRITWRAQVTSMRREAEGW